MRARNFLMFGEYAEPDGKDLSFAIQIIDDRIEKNDLVFQKSVLVGFDTNDPSENYGTLNTFVEDRAINRDGHGSIETLVSKSSVETQYNPPTPEFSITISVKG